MSEYFTFDIEVTDDPNVRELITNQTLSETEELYKSQSEGEEGSPIAQLLFTAVDGIQTMIIDDDTLIVTRNPDVAWEVIIDDIRDALRDFFL